MLAALYRVRSLAWLTCKWLKVFWPGCVLSAVGGLSVEQVQTPQLPGDDWVRVRTLLGGVCGSDLAVLAQRHPPTSILQAYSSLPMMLGHENVGVVEEVGPAVDAAWVSRRVCVEPTLCCGVRGIDPPCDRCREGKFAACENLGASGDGAAKLPAGTAIGYNNRTGGSWGECFVAHESQLIAVPDEISDELALLTDPVACGLHAVLRADLSDAGRLLVYGAGALGLSTVAALRAVGYAGRIDLIARYDYQGSLGRRMGADNVELLGRRQVERFARIAELTGGTVHQARFSDHMLSGGYDVSLDCVGSTQSLDECFKWTRSRGQVVLVGGGVVTAEATAIWFQELSVIGAWGRQDESLNGRVVGTYRLVHELMCQGKLDVEEMLTHVFRLKQYKQALSVAMNKAPHRAVKVAFDFR